MATTHYTSRDIQRFWSKVDKSGGEAACWNWLASCTPAGYGKYSAQGKQIYAHRISYEIAFGDIPEGMFVCHHCDNPRCVNPKHLFTGTYLDNIRDRDAKGRGAWKKGMKQTVGGAKHKITPEERCLIKQRYAEGGISMARLGEELGLCASTIFYVVHDITGHGRQ